MGTARKAKPLARNIFVAPGTGSDVTGDGTAANPFATWNGGAWPLIASLTHTDVTVTYANSTPDTSPTGTYALPPGVRVTLSCPWVDLGLGVRTVGGGSTTTSLVDSVGGLTVNIAQGSRIRFLTGALAGQVYTSVANSATAFTPGQGGFASAPVAGATFVIERPSGGWNQGSNSFFIDASAPGAGFGVNGFQFQQGSGFPEASFYGGAQVWNGGYFESAGNAASWEFAAAAQFTMGRAEGSASPFIEQPGSLGSRGVGCYFHTNAGVAGSAVFVTACPPLTTADLVLSEVSWQSNRSSETHLSPVLSGNATANTFFLWNESPGVRVFSGKPTNLTGTPFRINPGSVVRLLSPTFESTTTADGITAKQSRVILSGATGTIGGAGTVVLHTFDSTSVDASAGGNTASGGAGVATIGAHATLGAWPAGGTLTTDFGDVNPQGCLMRS